MKQVSRVPQYYYGFSLITSNQSQRSVSSLHLSIFLFSLIEKGQHMLISKPTCLSGCLHSTLIRKPDHYYDSLNIKLKTCLSVKCEKTFPPWFINLTAAWWGNFPTPLIASPTPQFEGVRHHVCVSSPLFNNANDKQKSWGGDKGHRHGDLCFQTTEQSLLALALTAGLTQADCSYCSFY